jgi:hypothetical protein
MKLWNIGYLIVFLLLMITGHWFIGIVAALIWYMGYKIKRFFFSID